RLDLRPLETARGEKTIQQLRRRDAFDCLPYLVRRIGEGVAYKIDDGAERGRPMQDEGVDADDGRDGVVAPCEDRGEGLVGRMRSEDDAGEEGGEQAKAGGFENLADGAVFDL